MQHTISWNELQTPFDIWNWKFFYGISQGLLALWHTNLLHLHQAFKFMSFLFLFYFNNLLTFQKKINCKIYWKKKIFFFNTDHLFFVHFYILALINILKKKQKNTQITLRRNVSTIQLLLCDEKQYQHHLFALQRNQKQTKTSSHNYFQSKRLRKKTIIAITIHKNMT